MPGSLSLPACLQLSASLQEYKMESTQIKNQDGTIRKLEEKIRALEASLEERGWEVRGS